MRSQNFLKPSTILLLIAFWGFTWHSYALGAFERAQQDRRENRQNLLIQKDSNTSIAGFKAPLKFKRRPFIVKADMVLAKPSLATERILPAGFVRPFKENPVASHLFHFQPLRAPPTQL
jgi:hypothetical protein